MEITMIIRVMTTTIITIMMITVITQDAHFDPVMITTTMTMIMIMIMNTTMQIMKSVTVKSC